MSTRRNSGVLGRINAIAVLGVVVSLQATTLEQLTVAGMAQQSTAIVRARVAGSSNVVRGANAYTQYRLEVVSAWKSSGAGVPAEVAVPGGFVKGLRQVVSGAPVLQAGREYVLFLWTSPRGVTQIMGLSQGLFAVETETGTELATRAAATERMLNAAGEPVRGDQIRLKLPELKAQVVQALGGRK